MFSSKGIFSPIPLFHIGHKVLFPEKKGGPAEIDVARLFHGLIQVQRPGRFGFVVSTNRRPDPGFRRGPLVVDDFIREHRILRNNPLFQRWDDREGLEQRSRRIKPHGGPGIKGLVALFGCQGRIILLGDAAGEQVGVIAGEGDHGLHKAGFGVQNDGCPGLFLLEGGGHLVIGLLLQLGTHRKVEILSIFSRLLADDGFKLAVLGGKLDAVSVLALQNLIIGLFQAILAHQRCIWKPLFRKGSGFLLRGRAGIPVIWQKTPHRDNSAGASWNPYRFQRPRCPPEPLSGRW